MREERGSILVLGDDPASAYASALLSFHFPVCWIRSFSGSPTVEYYREKEERVRMPLLAPLALGATRFSPAPISVKLEVGNVHLSFSADPLHFFRCLEEIFPEHGAFLAQWYRMLGGQGIFPRRLSASFPAFLSDFLPEAFHPLFTAMSFPFAHLPIELIPLSALSFLMRLYPHYLPTNFFYEHMQAIVESNGGEVVSEAHPLWRRRWGKFYWLSPEGKPVRIHTLVVGNSPALWEYRKEWMSGILPFIVHFTLPAPPGSEGSVLISYPEPDFPPVETRLYGIYVMPSHHGEGPPFVLRGIFVYWCKEFQWKLMSSHRKKDYEKQAREILEQKMGKVSIHGILQPEDFCAHSLRYSIPVGFDAGLSGGKILRQYLRQNHMPTPRKWLIPVGRMPGELTGWIEEAESVVRRFSRRPIVSLTGV
ncbi:MAG: hypothetical protein V2G48_05820 [bacterium JZ-2024 1]